MKLPSTTNVQGSRSSAGTVIYRGAAPSTDVAVQHTSDGGVRSLVTLQNQSASTTQRFSLKLPNQTELVEAFTPDGAQDGYYIVRSTHSDKLEFNERQDANEVSSEDRPEELTEILGRIDAPWAKDAEGHSVPTDYRLSGNELVQEIHPTASTAFPVVADPKISFGWGIYVKYNKAETKAVAKYSKASELTRAACLKVPKKVRGIPTRTICMGTMGSVAKSFQNTFKSAAKSNRCVQFRYTFTGALTEWKGVSC